MLHPLSTAPAPTTPKTGAFASPDKIRVVGNRPRVALVGISGYGALHLAELLHLQSCGHIELVACVAINAREHPDTVRSLVAGGCRLYDDYGAMLRAHAGRLELCCLPTPISWHAPMCVAALDAGANVLLEKPLAATLADAAAIAAAEQRSGRFVAVGYQDLYQPETLSLKQTLLAGSLGRIREIRVCAVRSRPLSYFRRNHWAGRIEAQGVPVYDSPVNNAFAHSIMLSLFLTGTKSETSARVSRTRADLFRAQPIENFDTAILEGETDAGIAFKIYATHSCATDLPQQILVIGEIGTAEWTASNSIRIKTAGGEKQWMLPTGDEARRKMFARVVSRLADPGVFICSTAITTEHVRLVNKVQAESTIQNIPLDWRQSRPTLSTGDEQIAIPGIETLFHDAFLTGKSFQEMRCPWASS